MTFGRSNWSVLVKEENRRWRYEEEQNFEKPEEIKEKESMQMSIILWKKNQKYDCIMNIIFSSYILYSIDLK